MNEAHRPVMALVAAEQNIAKQKSNANSLKKTASRSSGFHHSI